MEWPDWEPTYRAICRDFSYDPGADLAAARLLAPIVASAGTPWRELGIHLRNRTNIAVLGAGPSLDRTDPTLLAGRRVVCADGAVSWCRERGVLPDAVVTDLDGSARDLEWAAKAGSQMVVHAHGDNMEAVRELAPRLAVRMHGTCQCEPRPELAPLRNVGGFTDGDRAVMLLESLGARSATLYGFDFTEPPSRYSGRYDPATKPRKLAWAKRIVDDVQARGRLALTLWRP